MKILAIDASTKHFSLAVSDGQKVLKARDVILNKVLSDSIIPAIAQILKQAKVTVAHLDGFVVGLGPGSFTSLRVGLATVKGLAFASQKPVVGISSLDAIALNVADQECNQICVIADARRNLVYAAIYERYDEEIKRVTEYMLIDIAALLDKVEGKTLFVGDGLGLYKDAIQKIYNEAAQKKPSGCKPLFSDEKFWFPRAENLARLAVPRFERKQFDPVDKLVPLYLYPLDCQVQGKS